MALNFDLVTFKHVTTPSFRSRLMHPLTHHCVLPYYNSSDFERRNYHDRALDYIPNQLSWAANNHEKFFRLHNVQNIYVEGDDFNYNRHMNSEEDDMPVVVEFAYLIYKSFSVIFLHLDEEKENGETFIDYFNDKKNNPEARDGDDYSDYYYEYWFKRRKFESKCMRLLDKFSESVRQLYLKGRYSFHYYRASNDIYNVAAYCFFMLFFKMETTNYMQRLFSYLYEHPLYTRLVENYYGSLYDNNQDDINYDDEFVNIIFELLYSILRDIFNILEQQVTGINDENYIIDRTIIDDAFERVINAQLEQIRKEAINVKMNAVHSLRYRGFKKSNGTVGKNPIPKQVTHPMGNVASFLLTPENRQEIQDYRSTLRPSLSRGGKRKTRKLRKRNIKSKNGKKKIKLKKV